MKLKLLSIVSLAFIMLCSCTGEEVQQKSYLRSVAVSGDKTKTLTVNFYDDDSVSARKSGENLNEILRELEIINGKSIFTGHTEVIVLGECNYPEILTIMINEWKVSPSCLIVYGGTKSGKIIENTDPEKLANVLRTAQKQNIIPKNDIITVLSSLLQNGKADIPKINSDGNFSTVSIQRS